MEPKIIIDYRERKMHKAINSIKEDLANNNNNNNNNKDFQMKLK